jgi:hypothetical protein
MDQVIGLLIENFSMVVLSGESCSDRKVNAVRDSYYFVKISGFVLLCYIKGESVRQPLKPVVSLESGPAGDRVLSAQKAINQLNKLTINDIAYLTSIRRTTF